MIKIPGTDEGVPAIEELLSEGHQRQRHAAVQRRGLRARSPRPTSAGSSGAATAGRVARRPLGRVVLRLARRHRGRQAARARSAACELRGRAGLANARAAYLRFEEIFRGERFAALRAAGAPVQRPLWASTGVKDPAYPDTIYVDGLIGPRHGQHDADGDAARGRRPRRDRRPTGRAATPSADLQALADGRHRPRGRHRRAARGRHQEVRRADGAAARRASRATARRS